MSVSVAGLRAAEDLPSRWTRARRWQNRYGMPALGLLIVLAWLVVATAAPVFAPFPPDAVDVSVRLQPPGPLHWLGTDELGRDVLSRLIWGSRISLFTGFIVVVFGAAVGTLVGGIIVGIALEFFGGYLSASYNLAFAFAVLSLVILVRPRGLFVGGRRSVFE